MSAPAGRPAAVGAGLLAKLLAAVRPEFRVEVYVPAPDDPVLGRPSCVVPGCDRSGWEYGLCGGHSHRWRSRGRPDLVGFLTDPGPAKRPMKLDVELSKLELSKDVAAMANTTAGGIIVIGAGLGKSTAVTSFSACIVFRPPRRFRRFAGSSKREYIRR